MFARLFKTTSAQLTLIALGGGGAKLAIDWCQSKAEKIQAETKNSPPTYSPTRKLKC